MMSRYWFSRAVVPAALGVMMAGPASAQDVQLFTWMGRVDRNVRLTVQPNAVTNTAEATLNSRARVRMDARLPQQDGELRVSTSRGRGQVTVVQQPNASNGYTALIDIADPQSGAESYAITAYWTPTSRVYGNRGNRGNGRWGRGREASGGDYIGNAPALHWSGDVNSGVELVWRNGNVVQRQMRGGAVRNVASSLTGAATGNPNGTVTVNLRAGRGRVDIVQQPNAQNNYTTIIRIVDPQGGYGHYQLDAYWQ